jgi:hypothetical protein
MEEKQIRLGSVSLLCTFIILCVAVLTVLCVATVRADWQLTSRSAEMTTQWYELQNEGERWLAQADKAIRRDGWASARLPEGSVREEGGITASLERGGRTLSIRLEPGRSGTPWVLKRWQGGTQWEEEQLQLYTKGE